MFHLGSRIFYTGIWQSCRDTGMKCISAVFFDQVNINMLTLKCDRLELQPLLDCSRVHAHLVKWVGYFDVPTNPLMPHYNESDCQEDYFHYKLMPSWRENCIIMAIEKIQLSPPSWIYHSITPWMVRCCIKQLWRHFIPVHIQSTLIKLRILMH